MLMLSDGTYRATRTSWPCARMSATETIPMRRLRSRSSLTQVAVSAIAWRARARIGGRHRKARAVATENEREVAVLQRICDRSDHRSARHVHGLVAVLADCLGRLLHIGDAHHPIVRHWREAGFIRDMGKVAKDGQIFVEIAGGFECIHVRRKPSAAVVLVERISRARHADHFCRVRWSSRVAVGLLTTKPPAVFGDVPCDPLKVIR